MFYYSSLYELLAQSKPYQFIYYFCYVCLHTSVTMTIKYDFIPQMNTALLKINNNTADFLLLYNDHEQQQLW